LLTHNLAATANLETFWTEFVLMTAILKTFWTLIQQTTARDRHQSASVNVGLSPIFEASFVKSRRNRNRLQIISIANSMLLNSES
jgi:hypothetical protein